MEQQNDPDIGSIRTLINNKALLQYIAKEGDSSRMSLIEIFKGSNDERRTVVLKSFFC